MSQPKLPASVALSQQKAYLVENPSWQVYIMPEMHEVHKLIVSTRVEAETTVNEIRSYFNIISD